MTVNRLYSKCIIHTLNQVGVNQVSQMSYLWFEYMCVRLKTKMTFREFWTLSRAFSAEFEPGKVFDDFCLCNIQPVILATISQNNIQLQFETVKLAVSVLQRLVNKILFLKLT